MMKKLIVVLLFAASSAFAGPLDLVIGQRNTLDNTTINRVIPTTVTDGLVYYNVSTNLPAYATIGSGLSIVSGVLTASGGTPQVNADWNATSGIAQIYNKPTIATVGMTGQYLDLTGLPTLFSGAYADLTGKPTLFSGVYADLSGKPTLFSGAYSDLTGKPTIPAAQVQTDWSASSGIGVLLNKPSLAAVATSGSYNDLSNKPSIPTVTAFNFSQPTARTLAVSTSYQALDNTKAAVIIPSYACQNATQVLASSACTIQVRMGTGTLTCSTGMVYYTQSLTVALGVLITQNSTNPVPINLPIGASFILCAQSGTFTISTVEHSAG